MKLFATLLLLTLFTACAKEAEEEGLRGVWTLAKEQFANCPEQIYPKRGQTYCKIFTADPAFYACRLLSTPTGFVVIPMAKGDFDLIAKGNDEYLYF